VRAVAHPGFEPGQAKPTEADIVIPLAVTYAHAGRFADARDAIARAWSVHDRSGANSRADSAGENPHPRRPVPAARALVDEPTAMVSPASWATLHAQVLMARAEVDRLAGTPEQAEASLRAALRIYQDRAPHPRSSIRSRPSWPASPVTPVPGRPERPSDARE
jgi:hypothetical protein